MITQLLVSFFLAQSWAADSCQNKSGQLSKLPVECDEAARQAQILEHQGFDCSTPSPSNERGYRCRGAISGYPLPINIFIPASYQSSPSTPIALHFHGHSPDCSQIKDEVKKEKCDPSAKVHFTSGESTNYGSFATKAGFKGLFVMPESIGKDDTFKQFFTKQEKLNSFLKQVQEKAGLNSISSLSISSHSGGDTVINQISNWYNNEPRGEYLGKLKAVGLFDSLYKISEHSRDGIKDLPGDLYLYSALVKGGSTQKHNDWLKANARAKEKWIFQEEKNATHMGMLKDGRMEKFLINSFGN